MNDHPSFLGRGWSFPPEFESGGEAIKMAEGPQDIIQSLEIILGTQLGERTMQEEFGSSLSDFQFEEMTAGMINRMKNMVKRAILLYEIRIEVQNVEVQQDGKQPGLLLINIDFLIPASNSRYNMVYPYYLTEGNN